MDPQALIGLAGTALIGLALLAGGGMLVVEQVNASRRRTRLTDSETAGPARSGAKAALTGLAGKVKRVGDYVAPQDPRELSIIRAKLTQAGFPQREAVAVYLGGRTLAMVIAVGVCAVMLPRIIGHAGSFGAVAITGVLAGAAILGPDHILGRFRKRLELEYRDGFPDVLDLLVASVEAGLSLDAAVARVCDEVARRYPNLANALRLLTLELRAGRSRRDAWAALADRLGLEEARSFATMLRQAEEMGSSLGETLAIFSEDMRTKRMLRAEEKALALSAKLMLPLIMFLFPCLLGVLMMPAVYKIATMLTKH
ncbi:MAG TPA: type II secretion system F family protein [Caulobacteraceae bacterium]|nr:type II secretion system F family protein [Caulobacteraceae bacterium]